MVEEIAEEVCPESGFSPLDSTENRLGVAHCHRDLSRRRWLAGLFAASALGAGSRLLAPKLAHAGAARPIGLAELVQLSHHVVVATPRLGESTWEHVGESKRIVTYTRLTIDEALDDRAPGDAEVLVRTLGGTIGELGQIVHGEAELKRDQTAVLFLKARADGVFRVTALAQGHYPLVTDTEGTRRLSMSPRLSDFIAKDVNAASAQLRGQSIRTARSLVLGVQSGH